MEYDQIQKLGNSIIQHGASNDRIYLMGFDARDFPGMLDQLNQLAKEQQYSKIFAKIPQEFQIEFEKYGYHQEAQIPNYYVNDQSAVFMGKFLTKERLLVQNKEKLEKVLEVAHAAESDECVLDKKLGYHFQKAKASHASQMCELYKKVFATYPFPIFEEDYLIQTMQTHIEYYLAFDQEKLIGIASSEKDEKNLAVEMTDFAVNPDYRGKGIATYLLEKMEDQMVVYGMRTLFTIARARSFGMNIVFSKKNYQFSGTLINNTNIAGDIESMNIWYKNI